MMSQVRSHHFECQMGYQLAAPRLQRSSLETGRLQHAFIGPPHRIQSYSPNGYLIEEPMDANFVPPAAGGHQIILLSH